MKKISILLLSFLFIGINSISAQNTNEKVKTEKTCIKTGKVCDSKYENKVKGTCCNGEEKNLAINQRKNQNVLKHQKNLLVINLKKKVLVQNIKRIFLL